MKISNEYAAGFFDGEGCVYCNIRKGGRSPTVAICITSVDLIILEYHQQRWGGSISKRKMTGNRQQQYQWVIVSRMAKQFITDILQHSLLKREQLLLALKIRAIMERPERDRMDIGTRVGEGRFWVHKTIKHSVVAELASLMGKIRSLNTLHAPINALRKYS